MLGSTSGPVPAAVSECELCNEQRSMQVSLTDAQLAVELTIFSDF